MERCFADAQHDVGSSGNGKLLYRLFLDVIRWSAATEESLHF
jgi:hypothetical protein